MEPESIDTDADFVPFSFLRLTNTVETWTTSSPNICCT